MTLPDDGMGAPSPAWMKKLCKTNVTRIVPIQWFEHTQANTPDEAPVADPAQAAIYQLRSMGMDIPPHPGESIETGDRVRLLPSDTYGRKGGNWVMADPAGREAVVEDYDSMFELTILSFDNGDRCGWPKDKLMLIKKANQIKGERQHG